MVLSFCRLYSTIIINKCRLYSTKSDKNVRWQRLKASIEATQVDVDIFKDKLVITSILYKTRVWVPTLEGIALLFGIGVAFDAVVSFIAYIYLLKKKHINISNIDCKR